MTDAAALIAAVLDRPKDDTPRLVYAEWLDDHAGTEPCPQFGYDDGERHVMCARCQGRGWVPDGNAARAEFIRCQIELARLVPAAALEQLYRGGVQERLRDIPAETWAVWPDVAAKLRRVGELFRQSPETHAWFGPALALTVMGSEWADYLRWFARGFIESVTCPAADWLAHADAITAAHPVRAVTLTTVPDEVWVYAAVADYWRPSGLNWYYETLRLAATDALKYRWPRITFTLPPPARTHQYSHWQGAIDLQARTAPLAALVRVPAELLDAAAGYNYAAARTDLDHFRR